MKRRPFEDHSRAAGNAGSRPCHGQAKGLKPVSERRQSHPALLADCGLCSHRPLRPWVPDLASLPAQDHTPSLWGFNKPRVCRQPSRLRGSMSLPLIIWREAKRHDGKKRVFVSPFGVPDSGSRPSSARDFLLTYLWWRACGQPSGIRGRPR